MLDHPLEMIKASALFKYVLRLVIIMGTVLVILAALFLWGGGYWENIPPLDRISGPKWFKRYVVDPVPHHISGIRGGYSGFPQGRILTHFNYQGTLYGLAFLESWTPISLDLVPGTLPKGFNVTHLFGNEPDEKHQESWRKYLVFDEQNKRGYLYVP